MDREENVKIWTNIKYVMKDPRSSQVLQVQRLEHGVVREYTSKEDIEKLSKKSASPDLHWLQRPHHEVFPGREAQILTWKTRI